MPPIPILKPKLPTFDQYKKYLEITDQNRIYSNFGVLNSLLEKRIAQHASLCKNQVTTVSSATSGIICSINAIKKKKGNLCLLPSWTFVATACAVVSSGLKPFFVDVEYDSWVIDEERIKLALEKHYEDVAAIVIVAPFGKVIDLEKWELFSKKYDVPIVIDAAAGFDAFVMKRLVEINSLPVIISSHATKTFSTGEGGLVLSRDVDLIKKIKSIANFGIAQKRQPVRAVNHVGMNAKLSEYHAAIGLSFLDTWDAYTKQYNKIIQYYKQQLEQHQIQYFYPEHSLSSTLNILTDNNQKLEQHLSANNIETKRWWDNGCHKMAFYEKYKTDSLENTEKLSKTVLGIPLFIDIKTDSIDSIISNLN